MINRESSANGNSACRSADINARGRFARDDARIGIMRSQIYHRPSPNRIRACFCASDCVGGEIHGEIVCSLSSRRLSAYATALSFRFAIHLAIDEGRAATRHSENEALSYQDPVVMRVSMRTEIEGHRRRKLRIDAGKLPGGGFSHWRNSARQIAANPPERLLHLVDGIKTGNRHARHASRRSFEIQLRSRAKFCRRHDGWGETCLRS